MKVFSGDNPSELYLEALQALLQEGDKVAPRGKKILELRPAAFQFKNPLKRVTFLKGRKINPFFQLAECLWIISGKSDLSYLLKFNKAMAQFSDDGRFFNAPYGERLRYFTKNDLSGFVFNPVDQLRDVYEKIKGDRDSRQAVALIYNPLFDNFSYSGSGGKDTPCNLALTFKLRGDKLDLTVFNRSNDLHWGLFGANLPQFATIQEVVAAWLGVSVGTYNHITDSLHIYLEDYGHECTQAILNNLKEETELPDFYYPDCPKFKSDFKSLDNDLEYYWKNLNRYIVTTDEILLDSKKSQLAVDAIDRLQDPYVRMTVQLMTVYRFYKLAKYDHALELLASVKLGHWKVACAEFLYQSVSKKDVVEQLEKRVLTTLPNKARDYITNRGV